MANQMSIKTYSDLISLPTFEERYFYLRLGGKVGEDTFGFDRYLNQAFYKSPVGLVFYTVILEPVFYINTEILPKNFLKLSTCVNFIAVLNATAEVKF